MPFDIKFTKRLLTLRGLPSDSTSVLKTEPGKIDFKRRELSVKLAIMTSLSMSVAIQRHWRRHSRSSTSP